jgi:hypothetical protein
MIWLSCKLPATISSATSVTAVPISAATTPATTAATSATTAAKAPATTATASRSCSTATTTSAFTRRTSFVDDDIAAHKIVAVQPLDGALGFLIAIDLDKSEPAWLP